jgi:hypothetical protein
MSGVSLALTFIDTALAYSCANKKGFTKVREQLRSNIRKSICMAPVQPAPAQQGDQGAEKVAKVCRFFSCFSLKFRDPLQIQQRHPSNRIVFLHSWNTSCPAVQKTPHPAADADDG